MNSKYRSPQDKNSENDPKTQPKPIFSNSNLEGITGDMKDCSVIDTAMIKKHPENKESVFVVYIRPSEENIEYLLKDSDYRESYRFEGICSRDLKEKFEKATEDTKYIHFSELGNETYQYNFNEADEIFITTDIEDLEDDL
ncbi:hypothetical protein GOV14_05405 [Candidatus Pacearchaeota archaeon]|nr:hypothetical protein [Candidatus Pacearchaeota archaeon]